MLMSYDYEPEYSNRQELIDFIVGKFEPVKYRVCEETGNLWMLLLSDDGIEKMIAVIKLEQDISGYWGALQFKSEHRDITEMDCPLFMIKESKDSVRFTKNSIAWRKTILDYHNGVSDDK